MNSHKNEVKHMALKQMERLQSLKNMIVNNRMLDSDPADLNQNPITESLKMLQQAFMESDWPAILAMEHRAAINDHFWKVYETASYIDQRPDPADEKDSLLLTIDQMIQLVDQRKEVVS
jgi:hypothetical protein